MKKYNNIDDLFKKEVSNYSVAPSTRVWKNIESGYFKSKSTGKRNLLILLLILLILITGSIITHNKFNNNAGEPPSIHIVEEKIISTSSFAKIEIKEDNSTLQRSIASNSNNKTHKIANNETTIINSVKSRRNEIIVNTIVNTETGSQQVNQPISISSSSIQLPSTSIVSNEYFLSTLMTKYTTTINKSCTPSLITDFDQTKIDKYLEKRKSLKFYTGVSASIGMAYYPATTDQPTWSVDLNYGLKMKRYYIETGIGFQKMSEYGNVQIDYKTNDSIGYYNKVVSFELDPNNPNDIVLKTTKTTVYDSIGHYNLQSPLYSYNYLVIPIKFGYIFFQKSKFSCSAETGIIYNYLTKSIVPDVNFNDPESQLIGITNNTPIRVEHNFRIHIALRLNYKLSSTISLSAQPEFTSFINSIYEQSYNAKTRPYTMGIRFGVCFNF